MAQILRYQALRLHELVTGRRVLTRLQELNRTQWLDQASLAALQQQKLQQMVEYAYRYVPYYRRTFDQAGFHPGESLTAPALLSKLPTISKTSINENFDSFITTEIGRQKRLHRNSTGGSTGVPLIFMQDDNFRDYVTADIHRHIEWAGCKPGECHAYIWGTGYEVALQKAFRSRLMDWVLNRFLINAFALSEASMQAFVHQIRRRRPKILFGYASALGRFAEFVQAHHLDNLGFSSIISSAEVLYAGQRQKIERILGCKVFNRYGTRELGGIACECQEHRGLHISLENIYVEILRDNMPVPIGEEGDIVITNLNNYGMPFIRYHTGDQGKLSPDNCCCGRAMPMVEVIHGRTTDLFKTKDGRTVHGGFFDQLFYGQSEVKQFQIIQESYEHIVILIVSNALLAPDRTVFLERAIRDIMKSEVRVEFRFMESIPPNSAGKHRFIISKV